MSLCALPHKSNFHVLTAVISHFQVHFSLLSPVRQRLTLGLRSSLSVAWRGPPNPECCGKCSMKGTPNPECCGKSVYKPKTTTPEFLIDSSGLKRDFFQFLQKYPYTRYKDSRLIMYNNQRLHMKEIQINYSHRKLIIMGVRHEQVHCSNNALYFTLTADTVYSCTLCHSEC